MIPVLPKVINCVDLRVLNHSITVVKLNEIWTEGKMQFRDSVKTLQICAEILPAGRESH